LLQLEHRVPRARDHRDELTVQAARRRHPAAERLGPEPHRRLEVLVGDVDEDGDPAGCGDAHAAQATPSASAPGGDQTSTQAVSPHSTAAAPAVTAATAASTSAVRSAPAASASSTPEAPYVVPVTTTPRARSS